MLEKYLQEIGLSDKEASVYLSLLSVERASVIELSKKTKIKRTTIYVIIDSLAKKGLVSEIVVGKKTQYYAESPERLETFLDKQRFALEESRKVLKEMIPQIKSVQREGGEKPVVKYFEGREGIISTLEDFFRNPDGDGDMTYLIYPKDLLEDIFTEAERNKYREMRVGKNIKSKVFYTSEKSERPSDSTGERIKIDGKKYPITCDFSIYKDRVRINILGKKLSGIFIRSQDLADTLKSIFNLAFDGIKDKNNIN